MRPIKDAGWSRIKAAPAFRDAPLSSVQVFWNWVCKQDVTLQRVAWFLLRIADAREDTDGLEHFERVGGSFDPDRIWILEKETRMLLSDFILEPFRFID